MENFTLSIQTEKSKSSEKVISLGKRLIEELELIKSVDTLAKWMVHYLSEIIYSAEHTEDLESRKLAQEKCFDLILRLWDHRASFPGRLRPLSNIEAILNAIQSVVEEQEHWVRVNRRVAEQIENPWSDFLKDSYSADRRMACIAGLTAIAESHFGREKRWLKENEEMLSPEEAEIIRLLDGWLSSGRSWLTTDKKHSVGELSPEHRNDFILKELEVLVEKQRAALNLLKDRLGLSENKGNI